jgi:hypothetical protein
VGEKLQSHLSTETVRAIHATLRAMLEDALGACPENGVLSLEGLQSKAEGVVIWPLSLFY